MDPKYTANPEDVEKLLTIPNAVYEESKKNHHFSSLRITFTLGKGEDHEAKIEGKFKIAKDHNITGVGATYLRGKEIHIGIPLYGNDTKNNTEAIIMAFGKNA